MPRMQILTAAEHKAFDTAPVFSDAERETFFHLSESLGDFLTTLRSPTNQVCLVLTVGYFRAAKRFFRKVLGRANLTHHQSQDQCQPVDKDCVLDASRVQKHGCYARGQRGSNKAGGRQD